MIRNCAFVSAFLQFTKKQFTKLDEIIKCGLSTPVVELI